MEEVKCYQNNKIDFMIIYLNIKNIATHFKVFSYTTILCKVG